MDKDIDHPHSCWVLAGGTAEDLLKAQGYVLRGHETRRGTRWHLMVKYPTKVED